MWVGTYMFRKIFWRNKCWRKLVVTRTEDRYHKYCKALKDFGIDHRVWIDDAPSYVQTMRKCFNDPSIKHRRYVFYVRGSDLKKAQDLLGVYPMDNKYRNIIT